MVQTLQKPRLQEIYFQEAVPALMKEFNYGNVMEVPVLKKIVINMGVKEAAQDVKILDGLANELGLIAGQKPIVTKAKKSISAFKLREGVPLGLKVTLRKARMFEFADRLVNVAMPSIRDFRGYSPKGFDGNGNFTMGLQEHIIFPEVEYDKVRKIHGMDITFVTSAKTDAEGKKLLELLGFPFQK